MAILPAYLLGIGWLCWWVLKRDGTWREAAALFFSPILLVCALTLLSGQYPWIFFIVYAHLTALVFLPIYWALRRAGRIPVAFPLFVGGLSGVVTSFAFTSWRMPSKDFFAFVALGVVAGLAFWLIAFYPIGQTRTTD